MRRAVTDQSSFPLRYTLDKLPPLTKARRAKLKALASRPDSEIDTPDIPEMAEEQ